jgi:carbon storage regulator CsrA
MLVLSRKVGEELVVGDNIRITVVDIGNGRVKIGVTAPRDVHVLRSELQVHPATSKEMAKSDVHEILRERARSVQPSTQSV